MMNDLSEMKQLRVSVATYNRVVFPHPEDGALMLALERQASAINESEVYVRAQPFGGGIHILNPTPLREIIGEIQFDSERSRHERDFRILIPPSKWELIKEYCMRHLEDEDDIELETEPHRELTEEFAEAMRVYLNPSQYTVRPMGFVIENSPVRSENIYARGLLTVHIYRIFEVRIVDKMLARIMVAISDLYSDQDLKGLASADLQNYGKGRVNTILALPLQVVTDSYRQLEPEARYQNLQIKGHEVERSVLSILGPMDTPQYQWMRVNPNEFS
jgi:hypothetical protein